METLSTAYEAIEMLEALGLPLSQEQIQQVKMLEQKYIDEIIVPHIRKECEPLLTDIVGGCHLILEYNKEEGLTIRPASPDDNSQRISGNSLVTPISTNEQDRTKFSFNDGAPTSKRRIVLLVIKEYVKDHPFITFRELENIFPAILMRPYQNYGVVRKYEDVEHAFKDFERRYFAEPDDIIRLNDGTKVVVSTQWGSSPFYEFLKVAKRFYPNIRPVSD